MRNCPIALIVVDDRQVRQLISASLNELGCATCDAVTQEEALAYAARTAVDVVIFDVGQTDAVGDGLIRALRAHQPNLDVLYLIGPLEPVRENGLSAKAHNLYLRKPFHLDDLCDIVSSWLDRRVPLATAAGVSVH